MLAVPLHLQLVTARVVAEASYYILHLILYIQHILLVSSPRQGITYYTLSLSPYVLDPCRLVFSVLSNKIYAEAVKLRLTTTMETAATATTAPSARYRLVRSTGSSSCFGNAVDGCVALSASCRAVSAA